MELTNALFTMQQLRRIFPSRFPTQQMVTLPETECITDLSPNSDKVTIFKC